MKAQTIQIDSTFTSDGEIFPFSPNDTIYGLSISGSVMLNSDTSLVRVILTDQAGQEWMVYEAYPMIATDTAFDIAEECDETCYLEEFIPYTIQVQIINASFLLDSIIYSSEDHGDMESMQLQSKRNKDLLKIELMNEYITLHGWNWVAAENGFVNMYFYERAGYFGHNYNLLGREFYSGGVFYSVLHESIPHYSENTIIPSFDWRKKHNADIEGRPYYKFDGQDGSNGWMTLVKDQDTFNTCGAFATVAALEAAINLYANYQFDVDEQTTFSEKDAYNCSWNYGNYESGNYTLGCENDKDGKTPDSVLVKFRNEGVVNESCYPYEEPICEGEGLTCAFAINKCSDPNYTAQIAGYTKFNLFEDVIGGQAEKAAFLKEKLINYGPLIITLKNWPTDSSSGHAVCLVGFETNEDGELSWIFKNSWGLRSGNGLMGYCNEPFYLGRYLPPFPDPYPPAIADGFSVINYEEEQPITVICHQPDECSPNFNYYVHDLDLDEDGYYNWGIGPRIHNHPCGPEFEEEDSNDDNDRIGPYDDFYNGKPIMPVMQVCLLPPQSVTGRYIMNNSFFSFSEDDLDAEQYLDFYVENPGDAQLNLRPWGWGVNGERPVEIIEIEGGSPDFSMDHDHDQPQSQVCMDNKNLFRIKFTGQDQGELIKVKIYLDEDGEIPDFEFVLVYNDCEQASGIEYITSNEDWDYYSLKTHNYQITTGNTLTVSSEVAMAEGADIYVERGAKLVIDGGRLTSTCNNLWGGIDVWGNASYYQSTDYQGSVEVKNGGTIEYADTAIATARFYDRYVIPSGGIITCKDAIFKNNVFDVVFYPYTNINPGSLEVWPNASSFRRTIFETTDYLYDNHNTVPDAHVVLFGVGGISLGGCSFYNNSVQTDYSRGIGIESINAGYSVVNTCAEDELPCPGLINCNFENLDYGIRAFNNNSDYAITVDSADFTDNYFGISMSIVFDASIINNHFYLNADEDYFNPNDILVGIYTEQCTRYLIEENKITGADPDTYELVGMHILNSLPEHNEIYNDSLVHLTTGITAAGENRNGNDHAIGLCIKCNDFIECIMDVYVTPDGGHDDDLFGIATTQGLLGSQHPQGVDPNSMGAGNTFTADEFTPLESNFYNDKDLDQITYTHQPNTQNAKLEPDPYNNIERTEDGFVTYTKEGSCPSHLHTGGIQLEVEKSILSNENEIVTAYSDTLMQYVDGGDTPGLTLDIQTSFPDEALELRQQLLDESPYLSDTALKSAISKENVLLNAMVRDVLVANPQAVKSADILNTLENKFDPMPDYMMDEILEGRSILGEKENLERLMALHNLSKSNAFANIIRYYKNDTLMGTSKDSVMTCLENYNSPETEYQLAFCKLNYEDSTEVMDILNNIPIGYELTPNQSYTHEYYMDLFDILVPMHTDSVRIDSTSYPELISFMDETNEIPGIYARNILVINNIIEYSEPVYLPTILKNEPIKEKKQDKNYNYETFLKVYPNPAKSYLIIEYDLKKLETQANISIIDANGKKLYYFNINDRHNQFILDTRTYVLGIYLISLLSDNTVIENQKFIIAR